MEYLVNFGFSIVSSAIVAIAVVYFVFWKWQPKIEISKYIVKSTLPNGECEYKIKFINRSAYPANDVKIELWKKTEYNATGSSNGKNENIKKVKLSTPEWLAIPRYHNNVKIKKCNYAPHCITVRIQDEIPENVLKPNTNESYEFKISVKHGLSNISKTFSKRYNDKSILKEGRFVFGNSLETEMI